MRGFLLTIVTGLLFWGGCAVFTTRPVQEMSDTSAAMRAAREVQADTLAPELYREATEWWNKAKKEYKFKNFSLASDFAGKARHLAEQAEFDATRAGGTRTQVDTPPDPFARPEPTPTAYAPYAYPTPTGTPVEVYDQRHAEEEKAKSQTQTQQQEPGSTSGATTPNPSYQAPTPAAPTSAAPPTSH